MPQNLISKSHSFVSRFYDVPLHFQLFQGRMNFTTYIFWLNSNSLWRLWRFDDSKQGFTSFLGKISPSSVVRVFDEIISLFVVSRLESLSTQSSSAVNKRKRNMKNHHQLLGKYALKFFCFKIFIDDYIIFKFFSSFHWKLWFISNVSL